MRSLLALLPLLLIALACPDPGEQPIPCTDNADCPGTLLCLDGTCGAPAGARGAGDGDGPAGHSCPERGRCRADAPSIP